MSNVADPEAVASPAPLVFAGATGGSHRMKRVAILGNPNAGKSTLFNQLTGLRQKVGNYPGVTVEKKTGQCTLPSGGRVEVLDLPGSYSLQPHSPDETIVRDVLLGLQSDTPPPDLIVFVVDATHLARHLYLALQVREMGRPMILALNMMDAAARGMRIASDALERELGVPVVEISASRGEGIGRLRRLLERDIEPPTRRLRRWPAHLDRVLHRLESRLPATPGLPERGRSDLALALLMDDGEDDALGRSAPPDVLDDARILARRLDEASPGWRNDDVQGRYEEIHELVRNAVVVPGETRDVVRDRIDRVLTHRVWGPVAFLLMMGAMFQSVFSWAQPLMNLIDKLVVRFGVLFGALLPEGPVRSMIVNGVIAGVGTTLTFVPQIAILFLFISILEDTGYMARAAFIMDRLMGRVGLSGRAFIPLLSSFACAIPGIMATRTIDNRRDRIATTRRPVHSCSARLPVYALLIGAFIPNRWVGPVTLPGLTLLCMYVLGVVAAICVAAVLKRSVLKGGRPLYVMELPPYRMPSWRTVLLTVRERSMLFLRKAGTVILAVSVVLWFLASYPRGGHQEAALQSRIPAAEAAGDVTAARGLQHELAGVTLENSFAGRTGRFIEPAIAPLGFDWRIGIGLLTSLAAREVMVSTMATVFHLGDVDQSSASLRDRMRTAVDPRTGHLAYSPLVGVSLMVFFVLACQCMSTVAVVRRETNSWRWPIFMLVMMNVLAWLAAFTVYQGGKLLGLGV
jgi:ferrous iron transport protein B